MNCELLDALCECLSFKRICHTAWHIAITLLCTLQISAVMEGIFAWSNGGDAWAITQVFKMSAGKVTRGVKPAKACYAVEKHLYVTTSHDI